MTVDPRLMHLDQIQLTGLQAKGFHGVFDSERRSGQVFVVDAVLYVDTRAAAGSDDVTQTADYGDLAGRLVAVVRGEPVNLIETLAERLVAQCLDHPLVTAATVVVHKPSAPITEEFADVSVTITRWRTEPLADSAPKHSAVLALGANQGDRAGTLQAAVDALARLDEVTVTAVSPVVETDPVGGPEQPDFLNAVVTVQTTLSAADLLARAHGIEAALGRLRTVHWGPRPLDIDLITFGDQRLRSDRLHLPHPRAAERAFVLAPWLQLDPHAELPGHGAVADLLAKAADREGVRPRPDVSLSIDPVPAGEGR